MAMARAKTPTTPTTTVAKTSQTATTTFTELEPGETGNLWPGDQICWQRPCRIFHHAIVVNVSHRNKAAWIIHYHPAGPHIAVKKERVLLEKQKGKFFRVDHPTETLRRNPADVVLKRAKRLLGERDYNLFTNNCEHFAMFCKTGRRSSGQVSNCKDMLEKIPMRIAPNATQTVKDAVKAVPQLNGLLDKGLDVAGHSPAVLNFIRHEVLGAVPV